VGKSEKRQREKFVAVRMTQVEYDEVADLAAAAACSLAEILRAGALDRAPRPRIAGCSSRHLDCTAHHKDLVDRYDDVHYREKLAVEDETALYPGDLARWRENGGRYTTFKEWLRGNAS
jgi:hypothetical protein